MGSLMEGSVVQEVTLSQGLNDRKDRAMHRSERTFWAEPAVVARP